MPVLKHAKKKQRADEKKRVLNRMVKTKALKLLDKAKKEKGVNEVSLAFSSLDRAAKRGVFHKRKADRLKSRLAKLLAVSKSS
jgi:small subunit ribosomal protein S20